MGNYENLKQSITEVIRTNGNQEITGAVLQSTLLTIISTVGANATFVGVATPTTNPGTPDGPVFWIASESGTYSNFGSIELQAGLSVLMWNGSWNSQHILSIDDVPTAGSDNLVRSGGVQEELALGTVYDVSAKNPTAGVNNDGKWESLSALLSDANLNTLIPTAVRKGGMSIKFVQSSDNKYVQARLMADSFTTDVTQWQGVDDEPNWDNNLIKSSAIYQIEKGLSLLVGNKEILDKDDYESITNQFITSSGDIGGHNSYKLRKYNADGVAALKIRVALTDNATYAIGFYSSSSFSASTFISGISRTGQNMEYLVDNIPTGCKYIAIVNRETDYIPIIEIVHYSEGDRINKRLTDVENETQEIQQRLDEMATEETVYTSITGTNQNNGGNAYYIYNTGLIATDSNIFRATLFEIETGKQYCATANIRYSSTALAVFFDSQMNYLGYQGRGNQSTEDHYEKEVLIIPANTKYIGLSNLKSDSQTYPLLYKKETKILVSSGNVIFPDEKTLEEKANEHFSLLSNKRWACVGDSLTALGYTDKHYYDYVAEVTGIIPLNYGIGGTGYAKGENPFYSRISSIPLDVDVITVFGSGNDLSSGKAIGNIDDTDTTTICGCINQTLDNIFDRFPITPLAIVTPTPWRNTDMEDYVNAIVSICKKRGVPVCDLYHCSNMHPDSLTYRELVYSGDEIGGDGTPKGVHPNAIGHKIMAPHFLQTLESVVI